MCMNVDRALRNVIVGGIFLLPFLPLIVADGLFFPFITGKNFFFRSVVEILLALWAILALRNPEYRPRLSGITISVAVFVAVIALADLFGDNFFKSFWSNFERMEGLLMLLHVVAYFLITATVLQTERLWRGFWHAHIIVSLIVAFHALFQLWGLLEIHQSQGRVDASLGNATYLAAYMLLCSFITAYMLVKWRRGLWIRVAYGLVIALQVFIIVATATRGAMLGLIVGVGISAVLIAIFEKVQWRLRLSSFVLLGTVAMAIAGFLAIQDTQFVRYNPTLNRFANITLSEGDTRFAIWSIAWQGFRERPILGWGQENFNIIFNKYYNPKLYTQEPWFDHVHSTPLDWLVAGGLMGLLAYLAIPLVIFYYLWSSSGRVQFSVAERSVLSGMLAAYFFQNFFVFDTVVTYTLYASLLAYLYMRTNSLRMDKNPRTEFLVPPGTQRIATALVVVALVGVFYMVNVRGIATAATLIKALQAAQQAGSASETMLTAFTKAGSFNVVGSQEVAEHTTLTALALAGRSDVPKEVQQRMFTLARQYMEDEIALAENDARLRLFYASLLNSYGQSSSALAEFNRALKLSPGKPAIIFERGNIQLQQGNVSQALDAFRNVYDARPDYKDGKVYYAIAAIYAGDFPLVERILKVDEESGFELLITDERLLSTFVAVKRFDVVKIIWEARVAKDPANALAHLSLAGAYLQLGDRARAIEEVQTAIAHDPNLKSQGEKLIKEIELTAALGTSTIVD